MRINEFMQDMPDDNLSKVIWLFAGGFVLHLINCGIHIVSCPDKFSAACVSYYNSISEILKTDIGEPDDNILDAIREKIKDVLQVFYALEKLDPISLCEKSEVEQCNVRKEQQASCSQMREGDEESG